MILKLFHRMDSYFYIMHLKMQGNRGKNIKTFMAKSVTGLQIVDKINAKKKSYLNLLHIKQCKVHTRNSGK